MSLPAVCQLVAVLDGVATELQGVAALATLIGRSTQSTGDDPVALEAVGRPLATSQRLAGGRRIR